MSPVGLDISIGMLRRCRENTGGSIALVCADAGHMPFKSNVFDAVHSREISFFNSLDTENIINNLIEAKRVLKIGGTIMSMLPTKDYTGSNLKSYTKEDIRDLYTRTGFRDIDFIYPMKSRFLKISKRFYRWFTKLLKEKSFFIIGVGVK